MDFYELLLAEKLNGGGGGSAVLINKDITENGTYNAENDNADGYKKVVVNVPPYEQDLSNLKPVVFVDYDGSVVYNYTEEEFLAMDSFPANPSHSGLTAQGWNWDLAEAKSLVQKYRCLCVGQNYVTSDGLTKLYLTFDEWTVQFDLQIRLTVTSGTVTLDWGDGSQTETSSGTGEKGFSHLYSTAGSYVLTIKSNDAVYGLGSTGGSNGVCYYNNAQQSKVSADALRKLEIGNGVNTLNRSCFSNCEELQSISIPTTVTNYGSGTSGQTFQTAFSLKCIVFPKNSTLLGGSMFNTHHQFVVFPSTNVSNIQISGTDSGCVLKIFTAVCNSPVAVINGARDLKYFAVGGTYTTVPNSFCRNAHLVERIVVPSSVTEVSDYAFADVWGDLYMLPTSVPTLVNARAVNNCRKVYVPYSADHSVLNAYKTATTWSSLASKIEEMPQ